MRASDAVATSTQPPLSAAGHGRAGGGAGAADSGRGGGATHDAGPDRAADAGGDRRRRPAGQLAPVAEARVRRYLRAAQLVAPTGPVAVRSVRVCVPAEQVAEVATVVGCADRVRAVATRFARTDAHGRRCVTFRIL